MGRNYNDSRGYQRRLKKEKERRITAMHVRKRDLENQGALKKGAPPPKCVRPKCHIEEENAEREAAMLLSWKCDGCGGTFHPKASGTGRSLSVIKCRDGTFLSDRLRIGGKSFCAKCATMRRNLKRRNMSHGPTRGPGIRTVAIPRGWEIV